MTSLYLIAGVIGLWMLVGRPAFALSGDATVNRYADQEFKTYPVASGVLIYRNAYVGLNPAGYLKPFEPGDLFVGIAKTRYDNRTGSDGTINGDVHSNGDFKAVFSAIALTDLGKPVFVTADDTLSLSGHPDGYYGRLIAYVSATEGVVRMRAPGDIPTTGCILIDVDFSKVSHANVTAAGTAIIGGVLKATLVGPGLAAVGLGIDDANGEERLLLDNDSEAENITLETPQVFNITKGITATFVKRLKVAGGAATDDLDYGIASLTGNLTATERANMDAATAGLKSCKFHLDCNANDIFVSSDDDVSPVAAADTGVDNDVNTNKEQMIIARPGGACQIWIDKVRKLASTAFAVSATGKFCGFVNLEKSTGTGVPEVRVARMRIAGAAA